MAVLFEILCIALTLLLVVLLVRAVLSFVPNLPEPLRPLNRAVGKVTDPVLSPLRRLMPPAQVGAVAFDLSFLVVFVAISILRSLFC